MNLQRIAFNALEELRSLRDESSLQSVRDAWEQERNRIIKWANKRWPYEWTDQFYPQPERIDK